MTIHTAAPIQIWLIQIQIQPQCRRAVLSNTIGLIHLRSRVYRWWGFLAAQQQGRANN